MEINVHTYFDQFCPENQFLFSFRNHRFICPICQQGFQTLQRLNRHTETASPNNCNHCGKIHCHESQLRQHLGTNHFGGGVPARPANLNEPIIGQTLYQNLLEYEEILDEH